MSDELTKAELTDLWEELDNDPTGDNDNYPGEAVETTVPYRNAHSKRSRQMKIDYETANYDSETNRWN